MATKSVAPKKSGMPKTEKDLNAMAKKLRGEAKARARKSLKK